MQTYDTAAMPLAAAPMDEWWEHIGDSILVQLTAATKIIMNL